MLEVRCVKVFGGEDVEGQGWLGVGCGGWGWGGMGVVGLGWVGTRETCRVGME